MIVNANRHIGIRIRSSVISLIYHKSLVVDLTTSKEGIGKINNLISVDAQVIPLYTGLKCLLE